MNQSEMTAKIQQGDGFIAALDQSGGSTPKALKGYGIEEGAWSSDEEMFDLIHKMRSRIITSPCFGSGKVLGVILFERTMDGTVDGKPTPQALADLGVVPFIKIDKGLEDQENGVQLMKPIPDLDALLEERHLAVLHDQLALFPRRGSRDLLIEFARARWSPNLLPHSFRAVAVHAQRDAGILQREPSTVGGLLLKADFKIAS